jgi:hypothetical protein
MSLLLALALGAAPAAGFYEPPADRGASLPAGELYPRGRVFPFLGYSGRPERDLAGGFSAAGPAYTDQDEYLERASRNGWPVVAHVGRGVRFEEGSKVDVSSLAARVGAQVRILAGRREIVWWALLPEELRPWRAEELRYLEAAAAAVRANDPLGRPLYHYTPNDRERRWLEPVARHVDVLGKGAYANHMGFKRDRGWVGRGVQEMTAAIAATGRPVVPLVMPELSQDPDPAEDGEVAAWARHDVYRGLVDGAQGVLVWSLFKRPEVTRTWRLWYEAYSRAARELTGERGLGQVFLFGEPRRELALRTPPDGDVAWRELAHGPSRWLFVVNSSGAPTAIGLSGWPAGSRVTDAFTGAAVPEGEVRELRLGPYGVAGLRFDRMAQP